MGLPPAPDTPSGRRYRKIMEAIGEPLEPVYEHIDTPHDDAGIRDASLLDCSQATDYSVEGENIDSLIESLTATQSSGGTKAPGSVDTLNSTSSLGKRKGSETSEMSIIEPASQKPRLWDPPKVDADPENPFNVDSDHAPQQARAPIVLTPVPSLQGRMDQSKFPYGAQYEFARLVSLGLCKYDEVQVDKIPGIAKSGKNLEVAPVAARQILEACGHEVPEDTTNDFAAALTKDSVAKSPWAELDREEEQLAAHAVAGLGFDVDGQRTLWYGGQVLFHGTLRVTSKNSKTPIYDFTLEQAELSSSHALARRFGSKSIFRLRLHKEVRKVEHSDALLECLRRPLLLCGGVYRAFCHKDKNVFYFRTNEVIQYRNKALVPSAGKRGVGMSLIDFVDWFNPFSGNTSQKMTKYVSRFALGLSTSIPGIMLKKDDIKLKDDIESPSGSCMTDGAGIINRWSLKQLRHYLDWDATPSAIQVRVYGAKGLLIDDYNNVEEVPQVEITSSQRKIRYRDDCDPMFHVIDVLRCSHMRMPAFLSVETIINLAENKVSGSVFKGLIDSSLKELVEPLLQWDTPEDLRRLWCEMQRHGGVMASRRARESVGTARVKGYHDKDPGDSDPEDDPEEWTITEAIKRPPAAKSGDEVSGCPASLEETVMQLLDSGFTPQQCPILRSTLMTSIKWLIDKTVKKYKIQVKNSFTTFIVPDFTQTLKEGEFFFKSSGRDPAFKDHHGRESHVLLGDALIYRYPCKLPSDTQKWKGVDVLKLHHLVDVIVLSTQGDRRAADLLAGGDYDGDKATVIFEDTIVDKFRSAPLHLSVPPDDIEEGFEEKLDTVKDFLQKIEPMSENAKIRTFQGYALSSVRETSVVGMYSNFHLISTYVNGYRHRETIRLAHMFCMALDGGKTGMAVRPDVLSKDKKTYNKRPPVWKETDEDRENINRWEENQPNAIRPPKLSKFIMDTIYDYGKKAGGLWKSQVEENFEKFVTSNRTKDEDLVGPWNNAVLRAEQLKRESSSLMDEHLNKIKLHVEAMFQEHSQDLASPKKSPSKKRAAQRSEQQEALRALSIRFAGFPLPESVPSFSSEEIATLRASYAYLYCVHKTGGFSDHRFPWNMAMRELCLIKTRALGRMKAVDGEFYDHFTMKHPKTHET